MIRIGRCAVACLAMVALPGKAASDVPEASAGPADDAGNDRWRFRVTLDERPIGYHDFEVTRTGEVARVRTEARFEVEVLFITAYRYAHDNRETWRDDCLRHIRSTTDDNGARYEVEGSAAEGAFELERNDESRTLDDACVQTFAYWNPDILRADRLLNAQTGEVQDVRVEHVGPTAYETDRGVVESEEFVIKTDDGDIRLWYQADNQQWVGLETRTRGDRVLRYLPETLPEPSALRDRIASRRDDSGATGILSRP